MQANVKTLMSIFRLTVLTLLVLLHLPLETSAQEVIKYYHSEIEVLESSELIITETISVVATGAQIKRGIYRDFPTRYETTEGLKVSVGFDVLEVKRDGKKEPWHVKSHLNGKRVYVGDADIRIPPGSYTYELKYKTNQQVGFFDTHDQLFFNAIGHGWVFPIKEGMATVSLPSSVPTSEVVGKAYTGRQGSKASDYQLSKLPGGQLQFKTIKQLPPKNGLTIVVDWPKGHVFKPSLLKRIGYFVTGNPALVSAAFLFTSMFGFFFYSMKKVGLDPERGTIIPQYEAPDNLSPQEIVYLKNMGFKMSAFAAALLNMAYKGALKLELVNKTWPLQDEFYASDAKKELADDLGEKEILSALGIGKASFKFSNTKHKKISKAKDRLKDALKDKFDNKTFFKNSGYWFALFGLGVPTIFLSLIAMATVNSTTIFITIFTFVGLITIWPVLRRRLPDSSSFDRGPIAISIPFLIIGLGSTLLFLFDLINGVDALAVAIVGFTVSLLYQAKHLLKAPSKEGQKLRDKILGYKMYLETAESDRLQKIEPKDFTKELYEKHLPYAVALGVEQEWTENFLDALSKQGLDSTNIAPSWFTGSNNFSSPGSFSQAVGAGLATAIAASATAPGSSGSGGFSGGGGGGGGGGGW